MARVPASAFYTHALSIVPTPGDLPGHVVIPQLKYKGTDLPKTRMKEIEKELADIATNDLTDMTMLFQP